MHRFKKIVFMADGDNGEKAALSRAIELAEANDADLTIMDVLEPEDTQPGDSGLSSALESLQELVVENRRHELKTLAKEVSETHAGVSVDVAVEVGQPAMEVIRAVLFRKSDLVMKAAAGPMGRRQRLFGSTDLKLMRKCPCPVWIIQPSRPKRYLRILAALSLDTNRPGAESLDRLIMALATSLAQHDESELHVVHAWRLIGEGKLRGRQISTRNVDKLLGEMQAAHQQQFQELLSDYSGSEMVVHLIKGHPGDVIPDLVELLKVDLVVVGTVGRVGIPGLIIGNSAERILGAIDCSVLAVKPEGFETPVLDRLTESTQTNERRSYCAR